MLLQLENGIGGTLRKLLEDFQKYEIEGSIRQNQGTPEEQIRQEVEVYPYDLVMISAEQRSWLWRVYFGEIVNPLIHWIDRPVLVV